LDSIFAVHCRAIVLLASDVFTQEREIRMIPRVTMNHAALIIKSGQHCHHGADFTHAVS